MRISKTEMESEQIKKPYLCMEVTGKWWEPQRLQYSKDFAHFWCSALDENEILHLNSNWEDYIIEDKTTSLLRMLWRISKTEMGSEQIKKPYLCREVTERQSESQLLQNSKDSTLYLMLRLRGGMKFFF